MPLYNMPNFDQRMNQYTQGATGTLSSMQPGADTGIQNKGAAKDGRRGNYEYSRRGNNWRQLG